MASGPVDHAAAAAGAMRRLNVATRDPSGVDVAEVVAVFAELATAVYRIPETLEHLDAIVDFAAARRSVGDDSDTAAATTRAAIHDALGEAVNHLTAAGARLDAAQHAAAHLVERDIGATPLDTSLGEWE